MRSKLRYSPQPHPPVHLAGMSELSLHDEQLSALPKTCHLGATRFSSSPRHRGASRHPPVPSVPVQSSTVNIQLFVFQATSSSSLIFPLHCMIKLLEVDSTFKFIFILSVGRLRSRERQWFAQSATQTLCRTQVPWFFFFFFSPLMLLFFKINLFVLIRGWLLYCDGFCYTLTWIGHRHTCVLSTLNPPPTSLTGFSSLHAASISHFTLFKEFCLFYSYTKAFE